MVKIRIENLSRSFEENKVLDDFNLDINEGEILCILGKSGTGKSVILKHLVGIFKSDSGKIFVDGQEFVPDSRESFSKIISKYGILFQNGALFDSMNVYDNVAFGLRRLKLSEKEIEERVNESLANVGLAGKGELFPSELSAGMQKRAALARSIAVRPEIMLYDEPTTGVDPITAGAIDRLIVKMRDIYKITSIVVTHDVRSAFRIADRIAVLNQGKVVYCASPLEIEQSSDTFVRDFVQRRLKK
ncbi:MAG: Sulfate/thiosulfate import ATP-binding protein CysA [Spirochaetes bacterium ADurb.Bin218]|jgi:phospholipid/cholesterol/gamma-HCH transport system ATP-binding protein|nr:ATP-binding cassette domain-containing protein [Spirochaetota bacterium]OQA97771.1 MAG: Sulfate/thiosulfate import ATP-binding protein CysA [Spirochaetes bacterium ADurb.Bin218]HOQ12983.1 ATP-binding cassette domain-containing protein [Spirochaetota bacterium]HOV09720.1 ATP-binding cassette domain-containing protein [Spirochaetota bacterium]HPX90632.1 ATP-binding cassette domain-containing protein [Spirochaetota bacterium]